MHSHNPFHPDKPYAFDAATHRSEALPRSLIVRNRALDFIDETMNSGMSAFYAPIAPQYFDSVRMATSHYRRHRTHRVSAFVGGGKHYLKVVKRSPAHA